MCIRDSYYRFREIRTFSFYLVSMICFSDLIYEIATMFFIAMRFIQSGNTTVDSCKLEGVFYSFSHLSSCLWTTSIAYGLYTTLIRGDFDVERKRMRFFGLSFGIPFILTSIFYFDKNFGLNKGDISCWMSDAGHARVDTPGFYAALAYELILFICLIYNFFAYSRLLKFARMNFDEIDQKFLLRISFYPWVLLFGMILYGISVISQYIFKERALGLHGVANVAECLIGFFNVLIFGSVDYVRNLIGKHVCCCIPCITVDGEIARERFTSMERRPSTQFMIEEKLMPSNEDSLSKAQFSSNSSKQTV
eukprot:TRINITY_DN4745_c0_g1_i3.p1 TRINITY_DN4745_c0_g1~~TRINITY_DN4745_c0_g1_i3.p1  ORF type:complete len:326 (+),score=37.44 TRINITY_DN4745_c0_g1_i3:60-980(+)